MIRKIILASAASVLGLSLASSQASVVYQYDVGGPHTINATPGQAITVPLYLHEMLSGGSASLLNQNDGLAAAGLSVSRVSGDATISTISPAAVTDPSPTPASYVPDGFGGPAGAPVASDGSSGILSEAIGISTMHGIPLGNKGGGANPATPGDEVFLGTITLTAGKGGTSVFKVGPSGTSGGNTFDNNLDDLDLSGQATTGGAYTGAADPNNPAPTFSIVVQGTTVPEPASLGLLGLGALGFLARRRA
jgi:hypothetical protein